MQQQIMDMLLNEEEVSWKTILYDLVKSEQMDPWDVNITLLTRKYITVIKKMQEHNLRVSGKILLAAAYLLRLKSVHLVENDITRLDALINSTEEEVEDEFFDEIGMDKIKRNKNSFPLIPKNPQPRNRKVSIHDLVNALQRALVSRKRALDKVKPVKFTMPKKGVDIMGVIKDVFHKVEYYMKKDKVKKLPFTRLLPAKAGRMDKVYTFVPLLHLENQHKVGMEQEKPFDEIYVSLNKKKSKAK